MTGDELSQLRAIARDLHERRQHAGCWFLTETPDARSGDCGNWPNCQPECPLRRLREVAGYVPQEDGGLS